MTAPLLVEVIRRLQAELDENIHFEAEYDLFLRRESAELRLLLVDAAAAARHDPDVAAGISELYTERTRWLLDTLGDAYTDASTALFIITAISHGIGMEEAFGHNTPSTQAFAKTLSAMLEPITRRPQ